jgi:sporulation protein YlmC with PRC-barrel domain
MLQLSNALINQPILSLRTGTAVATVTAPVINPNNLKLEGFYCDDHLSRKTLVLLYQDIRDLIAQGFVINDHDVLAEPEELVRLKDMLELNFTLIGKPVETVGREKVGRVSDFATEVSTMYIQKLYVSQPLFKSLAGGSLSVDRTQINEITNKRIIINDLHGKAKTPAHATAPA